MDKYEYGIKSDQIKKMVAKKDYKVAAKIADTIDWSKVKSNSMLITVADAYEANRQYDKAKQVLLCAYERTPMGRQLAYRLSILSIKLFSGEILFHNDIKLSNLFLLSLTAILN